MSKRLLMIIALCVGLNGTLQAQTWKRLGPAGGMVISLGTGSDGTLYLGTADGHVFASQNGAEDWQLRGRVSGRTDAVITRLISDTRQAHHMLAAVWYLGLESGGGIFQSQDQGHTWTQLGLEHEAVRALETSAGNPGLLVAGTRTGVFRSEDDGTVWQRISPAGDSELRNIDSVEIDPSDSKVIYAGTYHLPWKTTDGGKTWKPVAAGLIDDSDVMSMRVDLTNPARLYLSACSGIYRTENQGDSWTKLQGIPYSARRTHQIVQDPAEPEALYAATTEGLWVTRDRGESWERATPKEWVVNSVVVASAPNRAHERVLIGTDAQGVLVSDDSGKHFRPANDGFTHEVVTQLVASPNTRKHLLITVERGGKQILQSKDAGGSWTPVSLGIGAKSKSDRLEAADVEVSYGTTWGWVLRLRTGQLWIGEDTGTNWKQFRPRLAINKANPGTRRPRETVASRTQLPAGPLAFSAEELFLPTQDGPIRCSHTGSCARLKGYSSRAIQALSVSRDGRQVYGIQDGKIGISNDGGETSIWRDPPVGKEGILWLDFSEDDKPSLFLGTAEGLFISANAGQHWRRQGAGLPAAQIDQWMRAQDILVAGLRGGELYVSRDRGATWMRADQDAERGRFTGIVEIEPGVLLLGSQSEGVLRLDLR